MHIRELTAETGTTERQVRYLIAEGFVPAPRGGRSNADYGEDHVAAIRRYGRLRDFLPLVGHPVPAADAELDEIFVGFLDRYRESWSAFPDARPALEVARSNGWRIGVLTNGSTEQQNAKLTAIGLAAACSA